MWAACWLVFGAAGSQKQPSSLLEQQPSWEEIGGSLLL